MSFSPLNLYIYKCINHFRSSHSSLVYDFSSNVRNKFQHKPNKLIFSLLNLLVKVGIIWKGDALLLKRSIKRYLHLSTKLRLFPWARNSSCLPVYFQLRNRIFVLFAAPVPPTKRSHFPVFFSSRYSHQTKILAS